MPSKNKPSTQQEAHHNVVDADPQRAGIQSRPDDPVAAEAVRHQGKTEGNTMYDNTSVTTHS